MKDEKKRYTEILAGISKPIVAINEYDELLLANASAEELLDLTNESMEQTVLSQIISCQELSKVLAETRQHRSASIRSKEIELQGPDGEARAFQVSCRSFETGIEERSKSNEHQKARGAVAVLDDISDRKILQKRNAEFVSSVSHEMKTPLSGIKAYVDLLLDGDAEDEETVTSFLEIIDSQADRLRRLVDNLLNLSRIEAGVVQVSKKVQSLNDILEGAVRVVKVPAEQKSISLTVDFSPLFLGVLADKDMLLQSAINLLSNAVKYTPDGGEVTLRSRMQDKFVIFEVEDTGVGLSLDDQAQVFEKFFRVQKNSQMASGTGLGLPLVKHIVEDVHGGALSLSSELNKGSCFCVTLQRAEG